MCKENFFRTQKTTNLFNCVILTLIYYFFHKFRLTHASFRIATIPRNLEKTEILQLVQKILEKPGIYNNFNILSSEISI